VTLDPILFVDPLLPGPLRPGGALQLQEASDTAGMALCAGGGGIRLDNYAADAESEAVRTGGNVREFVRLVKQRWAVTGVRAQVRALRAGVEDCFPARALSAFSAQEVLPSARPAARAPPPARHSPLAPRGPDPSRTISHHLAPSRTISHHLASSRIISHPHPHPSPSPPHLA
jgi:hypothetical protein